MNVTIKDIARLAKVSYSTVSRVLNGKAGLREETRKRVFAAARRLKYRPNALARSLVIRRTHTLGLIIPDITNPFFPEVARGIEEAARGDGYSVFLCNTSWEESRERDYLRLLVEKRVDGIIIAAVSPDIEKVERAAGGVPVVFLGRTAHSKAQSVVTIDNLKGGYLAAEHLILQGRLPLGFIGAPADSSALEERLSGFRKALREHGIVEHPRHVRLGDFRRESGYELVQRMIREGDCPRGLFGENDLLAIGALQGARELGLRVPEELAIVGFDDIPMSGFPEIQLTTVAQPKYEMGRLAMEVLAAAFPWGGRPRRSGRVEVLEPRLVIRKTA